MLVCDMHCDTISQLLDKKTKKEEYSLLDNNLHVDLKKMQQGDYLVQNFAMFICLENNPNPYKNCNDMIDLYYAELEKYQDIIRPVYNYQNIIENHQNGYLSSLLTIEEGAVINNDLSNLQHYYNRGVRMITLTWNFPNGIGYPNLSYPINDFSELKHLNIKDGLTDFGKQYIKEMERLGIIIDVSHLGDKGFYDVFENTTKPFVASHSNARSVCNVARNLSDDMILKLASRGGVMGINFCGDFLKETPTGGAKSSIKSIIEHIDYIKGLVGIDYIGLGSDFDGIEPSLEIKNASYMPTLEKALEEHGYSKEEIEKIFYKNVLRVYQEVLK